MKKFILLFLFMFSNPVMAQDLYEEIKSNVLNEEIDFSKPSSDENGRGIYKYGDIYYYRGDVANNYVLYSGKCFRILRTTDNGSIKLLYSGEEDNGTCYNGIDPETLSIGMSSFNIFNGVYYNGYMYNDLVDTLEGNDVINVKDSLLKQVTDSWFREWLSNDKTIIDDMDDTFYCNDREIWTDGHFMSYYRVSNAKPSLECKRLEDRFTVSTNNGNGKLTYPVGHITADELVLSGAVFNGNGETDSFTLVNKYWAMSPHSYTKVMYPNSLGVINRNNITYSNYVRPVITLKRIIYNTGDGTSSNPYRFIKEEIAPITGIKDSNLDGIYAFLGILMLFLIKKV